MVEIMFEDPPAVALAKLRTPGKYVDWAYALREPQNRGRWAKLPDAPDGQRSEKGAENLAQNIRRGATAGFKPKGSYEAVPHQGEIWVRYIGDAEEHREEPPPPPPPGTQPLANPAEVRAWAKNNGFNVPDRGRMPNEVYDAYYKAQGRSHVRIVEPPADEPRDDDAED